MAGRMKIQGRQRQNGIAAVEFGLIAPIVLLVLFGIFEFGTAFWRKQILTSAVREGARKGVVATNPRVTEDAIKTAVKDYLTGVGWDSSSATVTVTGAGGNAGTSLTVSATYPTSLQVLSHMMPGTFSVNSSGNVTLTATVVMQME